MESTTENVQHNNLTILTVRLRFLLDLPLLPAAVSFLSSSSQLYSMVKFHGLTLLNGWDNDQVGRISFPTLVAFKKLVLADPSLFTQLELEMPTGPLPAYSWLKVFFTRPDRSWLSDPQSTFYKLPMWSMYGLTTQHASEIDDAMWAKFTRAQASFLLSDLVNGASKAQFLNIIKSLHYLRDDVWEVIRPEVLASMTPFQLRVINYNAFWSMNCDQLRAFSEPQFKLAFQAIKEAYTAAKAQECHELAPATAPTADPVFSPLVAPPVAPPPLVDSPQVAPPLVDSVVR